MKFKNDVVENIKNQDYSVKYLYNYCYEGMINISQIANLRDKEVKN